MNKLYTLLAAALGANTPLANALGGSLLRRRKTDPIRARYPKPVISAPGEIQVWNEKVEAKKRAKRVARIERDRGVRQQAAEALINPIRTSKTVAVEI